MNPETKLTSFEDLCEIISKELAYFNDGIENTSDEYRAESVAIATCVKKHIYELLHSAPASTLRQDLKKIFNFQANSQPSQNDLQPKIFDQSIRRVFDSGRKIRRRSSAGSDVCYRADSHQSLAKPQFKKFKIKRRVGDY